MKPGFPMLRGWNVCVGSMDFFTGMGLILIPDVIVRVLGLRVESGNLPFLSWIGAFVLAIGASYAWAISPPKTDRMQAQWEQVWKITALVRSVVAIVLTTLILRHQLSAGWWTVAATDAVVAFVQWTGLKQGWINDDRA